MGTIKTIFGLVRSMFFGAFGKTISVGVQTVERLIRSLINSRQGTYHCMEGKISTYYNAPSLSGDNKSYAQPKQNLAAINIITY
jgi:hypothetical protein